MLSHTALWRFTQFFERALHRTTWGSVEVWALARSGDTKGAAECLRSMRQAEVMPNMVSFSGVLHSFVGISDFFGEGWVSSKLLGICMGICFFSTLLFFEICLAR